MLVIERIVSNDVTAVTETVMENCIWVTRQQLIERTNVSRPNGEAVQTIVLEVAAREARTAVPSVPEVSFNEEIVEEVCTWYAMVSGRPVVISIAAHSEDEVGHTRASIETPYAPADDKGFDWTVLRELAPLPREIIMGDLLFLEHRAAKVSHVVYRSDRRGSDYPVYGSARRDDAEGLIEFLRATGRSANLWLARPDLPGDWIAFMAMEDTGRLAGRYPDRCAALELACHLAGLDGNTYLVVSDAPCADTRRYTIRGGKVTAISHRGREGIPSSLWL